MENRKIAENKENGTFITLVGGNNTGRIGGNSYVIEVQNEGRTSRSMIDLGAVITGFETGYESAFPDVSRYFDRINPVTGEKTPAQKTVNALFITHAHEDHIGALVNYVRMGYQLPPIKTTRFTKNLIALPSICCCIANSIFSSPIVSVISFSTSTFPEAI